MRICFTLSKTKISDKPRLSFYNITNQEIKDLLSIGPVGVAISSNDWEYYSNGIWKCKPQDPINHAVVLIGYTRDAWIVKNQWGKDWG